MDDTAAPTAAPRDDAPVATVSARKAIAFAAFLALGVAVVLLTPLRDLQRPEWIARLREQADDAGLLGQAAFVLACAVGVAVGVPRLGLAFVAGAVFGFVEGALLAQAGGFLGCWATFVVGRQLGRTWTQSLVARRLPRMHALLGFISRHGFAANVLLRLVPVGNAFATNLLFAVSDVTAKSFLAATLLGTLPHTFLAALTGSTLDGEAAAPRLLVVAAGLVVVTLGVAWWTRRSGVLRR